MHLIYHGHSFDYAPVSDIPVSDIPSTQPRAVNWRYQVASHHLTGLQPATRTFHVRPNAVNWRYRAVVEA